MKKLISLLLAALLLTGCAAFAETAPASTPIENTEGAFPVKYILPENAELINEQWGEVLGSAIYQARIKTADNLLFYFSVIEPAKADEEANEEVQADPITYNEANGYTDEAIKEMIRELYSDDSSSFDADVLTTAYGTKLALVRFNDESAPFAYMFTIYQGYEFGLTVEAHNADETLRRVTDEEIQKMVDFASEFWMGVEAAPAE